MKILKKDCKKESETKNIKSNKRKIMKRGLFVGLFLLFNPLRAADEGAIAIDQVVSVCCNEGEQWGSERKSCSSFDKRLDIVPDALLGMCLSTVEICCSKQEQIYQCTAGQVAAKGGQDCKPPENVTANGDAYKGCCEACKVGLFVGASDNKCALDPFSFGQPWDEAYTSCCGELKHPDSFIISEEDEKNLCGKFDKLCTQLCENTDGSYICKCYNGYMLLDDKRTCVPAEDRTEDNDVNFNGSNCEKGYKRDEISNACIDIDECATRVATCNLSAEVCFNTDGSYKCIDIHSAASCPKGYRYNVKTETCQDVNECLEQTDDCDPETQRCFNTRGNYLCQEKAVDTCFPGFSFNSTTKACEDINECEFDDICEPGEKCKNVIGSFECIAITRPIAPSNTGTKKCEWGFRWAKDKCVDVDECASNPCDKYQKCTNEIGGFRCDCKLGFLLDPLTNACVDINECQINNHECLESQRCDNTIGSYTCIRLQSCGTGYTLNAETGACDDDDECVLGRHNCQPPYECRNTKGSFRCVTPRATTTTTTSTTTTTTLRPTTTTTTRTSSSTPMSTFSRLVIGSSNAQYWTQQTTPKINYPPCDKGFERSSAGACVDINECEQTNPCRWNQKCINTNGSYKCHHLLSCPGGHMANIDGTQCIDIDECQTGEARCGPDQICKNKIGGYVCNCPFGMENKNFRCEDINECERYKDSACPSNSVCINTVGSYICDCKSGFHKENSDSKRCEDVDECKEIAGLCHQRCINYWGSYRCACDPGYKLNENNRTCDDVNECEMHVGKSYDLCMGRCENTPGSYICTCPSGYSLAADGRICEDVDECETTNYCRGRNEICTNTRGGYHCTRIDCPYGYILDAARKNRCKRVDIRCDRDDIECFRKPSSYSYNFITITSNISLPPQGRPLFNLRGPNWYENIDFELKVMRIDAPPQVQKASEGYFSMNKMKNEVLLNLVHPIQGPQEIELELTMTVYQNNFPSGSNVAKIFILVSEHTF